MKIQAQEDYVRAINEIAVTMPLARTMHLHEFALFLQTHPLPAEETFEEFAADEARWDAQFEATGESALAALVAAVETEIEEGKTLPMFDERGQFIERA